MGDSGEEKVEKEASPKPVETGAEPEEASEKEGGKKRLKISRMELPEVEKALEKTMKAMGGMQSRHARALLGRKACLESAQPKQNKKAA